MRLLPRSLLPRWQPSTNNWPISICGCSNRLLLTNTRLRAECLVAVLLVLRLLLFHLMPGLWGQAAVVERSTALRLRLLPAPAPRVLRALLSVVPAAVAAEAVLQKHLVPGAVVQSPPSHLAETNASRLTTTLRAVRAVPDLLGAVVVGAVAAAVAAAGAGAGRRSPSHPRSCCRPRGAQAFDIR